MSGRKIITTGRFSVLREDRAAYIRNFGTEKDTLRRKTSRTATEIAANAKRLLGPTRSNRAQPLKNVEAVGEFRTKAGELVKSETALLEYNPILPGQTSPFRAGGTHNSQIADCGLSFKYLMGGTVDYTERTRKKGK